MGNGFYTVAQAMLMQQRKLSTLSNNMANIKTNGFKREEVIASSFDEVLKLRVDNTGKTVIGTSSKLQTIDEISINFNPSDLEQTQRTFDVAIGGFGFFEININNNTYYTRNGGFEMDDEGYLILPQVGRVSGENGDIQVLNDNFAIDEAGNVYDENGFYIDKIRVVDFADYNQLVKAGNGLFTNPNNNNIIETEAKIMQGFIERSNVDVNKEMTSMIEIQRNFQSVANALKTIDQIDARAVSEIGKI